MDGEKILESNRRDAQICLCTARNNRQWAVQGRYFTARQQEVCLEEMIIPESDSQDSKVIWHGVSDEKL